MNIHDWYNIVSAIGIGTVIAVPTIAMIEKLIKENKERKEIESESAEDIYEECYREILRAAIHEFAKERQNPELLLMYGPQPFYEVNPSALELIRGMKKYKSLDEKVKKELKRIKQEISERVDYDDAKFRAMKDRGEPSIPVEYKVLS